ncbi:MAG: hypothetical protein ABI968_02165 [Acidobacteriota bacterium]
MALLAAGAPARPGTSATTPALGVGLNLPDASAAVRQAALDSVRRTGASFFALEVSWSAAEPHPREYHLEELASSARLLRQSGATLHLLIPLVTESARDVPADLIDTAFDDPKLSLRLGRFLEALTPVLLDVQSLSLGAAADTYFADKPEELRAYRRLFQGAVEFLQKKMPQLMVGVTTSAPSESRSPEIAAVLHQKSPVLFYTYSPLVAVAPFTHREPAALDRDWAALLKGSGGKPIAFPEVSYSSSPENGSSPEKQAEFIRRFRRFLAKTDGHALLFARYLWLRDPPSPTGSEPGAEPEASVAERRRRALLSNCGLQDSAGHPKPAWREWLRESAGMKR